MLIESDNLYITKHDIQDFESKFNISLPEDYQEFLLKFNGGEPELYLFEKNESLGTLIVNSLYGIKAKEDYEDLEKLFDVYSGRISNQFLAIGDDPGGNQFALGISGDFKRKVYFWDHNEELENDEFTENELPGNMYELANSFTDFIDQLEEDKGV